MKIGSFKVQFNDEKSKNSCFAFYKRLENATVFEMRGLEISKKGRNTTSSNHCTLYILNNGTQVYKYGDCYAVVAASDAILDSTIESLRIKSRKIEFIDSSQLPILQ